MEPDELEAAKSLLGPGNSATSDSFDNIQKEMTDITDSGDPANAMAWGMSKGLKPSENKILVDMTEKKAAAKKTYSNRFKLASDDLAIVNDMISSKSYENYGGVDAAIYKTLGLNKLHTGYGEFLMGLEKLNSSAFMQNVDALKGMGALSDSEGKKIAEAQAMIFSLLPNKDGSYNKTVADSKILTMLEDLKSSYESAITRYTAGDRKDLETGEMISQSQYEAKYPELPVAPTDQIKADDNKEKGVNDPNTLDFRDPVSKLSMSEQMTEAVKKANLNYDSYPSGFTIIFPNGTVKRKR